MSEQNEKEKPDDRSSVVVEEHIIIRDKSTQKDYYNGRG